MRQLELNPTYEVVTPPQAAVLTAADLRLHSRIDAEDEDELLEQYIAAATALVEVDSRLFLRPAGLRLHLDRFPIGVPVCIQRCPVTELTAVKYLDVAGELQTWEPENYRVNLVARPARLEPVFGVAWPAARRQAGAIEIEFEAGFAEGEVPEIALQMIRLLVATWYEHRESVATLTRESAFAYSALLERLQWQG